MDDFVGTWKLEDSDKFDEYMIELGVSIIRRQIGKRCTPIQEITKDGDNQMTFKTTTGSVGFTTVLKFTIGQELEEKTMDGRTVKTTINLEDGKLVQTQPGDPSCKITREIKDGKYVMTLEIPEKNIECKRIYARQ